MTFSQTSSSNFTAWHYKCSCGWMITHHSNHTLKSIGKPFQKSAAHSNSNAGRESGIKCLTYGCDWSGDLSIRCASATKQDKRWCEDLKRLTSGWEFVFGCTSESIMEYAHVRCLIRLRLNVSFKADPAKILRVGRSPFFFLFVCCFFNSWMFLSHVWILAVAQCFIYGCKLDNTTSPLLSTLMKKENHLPSFIMIHYS